MNPQIYTTREEINHFRRGVKDALEGLVDDKLNRARGKRADAYRDGLAAGRMERIEKSPFLTRLAYVDSLSGKPLLLRPDDVCDLRDLLIALREALRLTNEFQQEPTTVADALRYQEATEQIVDAFYALTENRVRK